MTLHELTKTPALVATLALLVPASAGAAIELRDGELVAGGSAVLQSGTSELRIEDARLGRIGGHACAPAPGTICIVLPEPAALWQLGAGTGLLALLARHRSRRRAASKPPRRGTAR